MVKRKSTNGKTTIYKTLHIKLKIGQREPYNKLALNSGATEGYAVPAAPVAPVVLISLQTR
jgi:hypothetical protein